MVDISKDYFHKNQEQNRRANNVLTSLYNSGAIPLLTWHHIEELLAHKNDKVVSNSIALVRNLPFVASLICHSVPFHIGSIIDIETIEFKNILSHPNVGLEKITEETRKDIFYFCSGEDLITPYMPHIENLRQEILAKENRKKEIASISRAQSIQPQETKLSFLRNSKLRSLKTAEPILHKMQNTLKDEIHQKGDKKIQCPEKTVNEFMASVYDSGRQMHSSSGSIEERFLKEFGLNTEETKDFKTLEQVQYLSIFKKRLGIIAKNFPHNRQNSILELKESSCPSWLLWKELHKIRTKADRANGSDLNDGYLAGLVCYASLTIVDKRTNEYLLQIQRKDKELKSIIGKFEKISHYEKIIDHLPE